MLSEVMMNVPSIFAAENLDLRMEKFFEASTISIATGFPSTSKSMKNPSSTVSVSAYSKSTVTVMFARSYASS